MRSSRASSSMLPFFIDTRFFQKRNHPQGAKDKFKKKARREMGERRNSIFVGGEIGERITQRSYYQRRQYRHPRVHGGKKTKKEWRAKHKSCPNLMAGHKSFRRVISPWSVALPLRANRPSGTKRHRCVGEWRCARREFYGRFKSRFVCT